MTGVDLAGSRVCVAGLGVAGTSAARALAGLGADVVTADRRDGTDQALPAGTDLVVASPGWRPDQPLLAAAAAAGVPVWGDVELAWRLRRTDAPWLGVTGTNGKTTTVRMLESILRAAGYRAVACGNVGLPVLDAVLADDPYDVLAVEVSSFQLHWMQTVEFRAAAVLNIAPDHLDWHGSMEAYTAAKASDLARRLAARSTTRTTRSCRSWPWPPAVPTASASRCPSRSPAGSASGAGTWSTARWALLTNW